MKLIAAAVAVTLICTAYAVAAEPPPRLELQLTLVEMPPGGAIAGGFLDTHAIEAGQSGGLRVTLLTPDSNPQALSLDELVTQGNARVLAQTDFATDSGQPVVLAQMVAAPFALQDESELADESAAQFDYPGQLGLAVRVEPTLDEDGQHVLLKIEWVGRSAQTFTSTGSGQTTEKHFVNRSGMKTALKVKLRTTVSFAGAMLEEDRRDLAELPGMADLAVEQPFFAAPTLGWVLYLLVSPTLIEDQ